MSMLLAAELLRAGKALLEEEKEEEYPDTYFKRKESEPKGLLARSLLEGASQEESGKEGSPRH